MREENGVVYLPCNSTYSRKEGRYQPIAPDILSAENLTSEKLTATMLL